MLREQACSNAAYRQIGRQRAEIHSAISFSQLLQPEPQQHHDRKVPSQYRGCRATCTATSEHAFISGGVEAYGYYSATSGKFHMGEYARRGFDEVISEAKKVGDGGEEMWVSQVKERPKDQPFFMWFAAYDAHRAWGPNEFAGTHNPVVSLPATWLMALNPGLIWAGINKGPF